MSDFYKARDEIDKFDPVLKSYKFVRRLAFKHAFLFGRAKRAARERARTREQAGCRGKESLQRLLAHKFSFLLRSDEVKYHWLKNYVPKNKVD